MNKKLIIALILPLIMISLSGCNTPVMYSDKFEGIPIYPGMDLISSSDYEDYYEISKFEGTFEEVKEFYKDNIDQKKWEMKENPLYQHEDNSFVGSKGYILKGKNQEVSLIIERIRRKDRNAPLYIRINGNPLEEGIYRAKGQSEHWKASLEYTIRKDKILISGDVIYIGDHPPEEVYSKLLLYEIKKNSDAMEEMTVLQETPRQPLQDFKFDIFSQSSTDYTFESYKKAINNAYIEISWKEQDRETTEKIEIVRY